MQQQQQQPEDPQLHIYDDLDNTSNCLVAATSPRALKEIEPQRVSVESVLARGEYLS